MNGGALDLLDDELARARAGGRAALAVLVQAHQRAVYSLALRMLGTRDLAEDLTQDVFMQLNGNLTAIESNKHLGFKGLRGIYVRSYTFDKDSAYQQTDIDAVRAQLAAPGWNRLVETHSRKTRANVDIYIMIDNNRAIGLALIASEPRQFTIVNIIGAIDLDKLHKLEGQFGVPKLDIDLSKTPTQGAQK